MSRVTVRAARETEVAPQSRGDRGKGRVCGERRGRGVDKMERTGGEEEEEEDFFNRLSISRCYEEKILYRMCFNLS